MSKFRVIKNNLLGGQISPTAFGRTDSNVYAGACKTLKNMIPISAGGAYRRPGTVYETSFSSASYSPPALIPFIYSKSESYLLTIARALNTAGNTLDITARRITSNLTSTSPATVTVTNVSSGYATACNANGRTIAVGGMASSGGPNLIRVVSVAHGFNTGHKVSIYGVLGTTESNTPPYWVITVISANAFDLVGSVFTNAYVSGGFVSQYWDTVGNYDEQHNIQYAQSGDVMWLVHPNRKPLIITRNALDDFTVREFDSADTLEEQVSRWPFRDVNAVTTTKLKVDSMGVSGTTGVTLALDTGVPFFNIGHIGAIFKISNAASTGAILITEFVNSSTMKGTVLDAFPATTGFSTWWESAWSDYRGWPTSVCFYQQRLCFGGSASKPDSIYVSRTSNYRVMSILDMLVMTSAGDGATTGPLGEDPFTVEISSQQLNRIQWMTSDKTLLVGTIGDEAIVSFNPAGDATGFGADTVAVEMNSHHGSASHQPVRTGTEIIVARASDDEVRALSYDDNQRAYADESLQLFFDEYPKVESFGSQGNRKYRTIVWDQSRRVIWCCDTAGNLFGMTRDKSVKINAWHTHQMGGYNAANTSTSSVSNNSFSVDSVNYAPAGSVVSLAVVPNPLIGVDDLWMVVKRLVNGVYVYHVERMIGGRPPYDTAYGYISNGVGSYFVDASRFVPNEYDDSPPNPAATTFAGFSHLEGTALSGTASNPYGLFVVSTTAVSGGNITINTPLPGHYTTSLTALMIGLPFTSIVEPVRIEVGSPLGTNQGAIKRIHEVLIRFYKTIAAKVGSNSATLETIIFRTGTTPMGSSAELFTGDKRIKLTSSYDRDGLVYITTDQPLPFAVISLVAEGQAYD